MAKQNPFAKLAAMATDTGTDTGTDGFIIRQGSGWGWAVQQGQRPCIAVTNKGHVTLVFDDPETTRFLPIEDLDEDAQPDFRQPTSVLTMLDQLVEYLQGQGSAATVDAYLFHVPQGLQDTLQAAVDGMPSRTKKDKDRKATAQRVLFPAAKEATVADLSAKLDFLLEFGFQHGTFNRKKKGGLIWFTFSQTRQTGKRQQQPGMMSRMKADLG